MKVYQQLFSSWKDVQSNFNTDMPEPTKVLLAYYDYEDYSGSAIVIYKQGRKYYMNEGGHCSCYGLEDQWKPEEYPTKKEFLANLKMRTFSESAVSNAIYEIIKKLER